MRFPAFIRRWRERRRIKRAIYEWKVLTSEQSDTPIPPLMTLPPPGESALSVYYEGKLVRRDVFDESKQQTIYISETGDDANDGLTTATAKRTFRGAKEAAT